MPSIREAVTVAVDGTAVELILYLTWTDCWSAVARVDGRVVAAASGPSREEAQERAVAQYRARKASADV